MDDLTREELESAVYNMYGMLRIFIPSDQKGMTDARTFIEKQKPMMETINKKIRHDAVERTLSYLSGMGLILDIDTINKCKEAATAYRKIEKIT